MKMAQATARLHGGCQWGGLYSGHGDVVYCQWAAGGDAPNGDTLQIQVPFRCYRCLWLLIRAL